MTDRYNHITVVLEKEMREDDAETVLKAISMIKGVLIVTPNVANPRDHMIKEQAKHELLSKIYGLLK